MTRTSLTRYASAMQDAQPLTEHEKRELGRRLWLEHSVLVVLPGWAPRVIWDACVAIAKRLYGERGI